MKKLLSFSFYDFGNSVFPMIIITTLTSSYFVNHVIENQQTGTALWQLIIGVSGILIALMMPFIGKLSDEKNCKLNLLGNFQNDKVQDMFRKFRFFFSTSLISAKKYLPSTLITSGD